MAPNEPERPIAHEVEQEFKRYHPLQRLLLLDVICDKESRPVFYWAGGMLLAGVLVYHWLEGWSYLDALYFSVVSLATVGYGDLTPTTPFTKLFTIIYLVNGISILLALFDRIRVVRARAMDEGAQRRRKRAPTRDDISADSEIASGAEGDRP